MAGVTSNNNAQRYMTNRDGLQLFCKHWADDRGADFEPRALVFICHGFAEHCLTYGEIADQLLESGFYPFANDHVGHGQSEGKRADNTDFQVYIRDVIQHARETSEKFPQLPLFIIGHSMGGAIAIIAGLQQPDLFTGEVLISPAVIPFPEMTCLKTFLVKGVGYLFPQLVIAKRIDSSYLTRDTEMVEQYRTDPRNYTGGIKARFAYNMYLGLKHIQENLEQVNFPFLVLHGDADCIVPDTGSKSLFEKARSQNKTLKIYPGFYHQLHKEPKEDGAQVKREIIDWLNKETKAAA